MKKVLSWVLVLALVLSSFTMAFAGDTANSSDMKDAAAIKNVEAVDVMVATGIIGGYPDGYYYPEKAVTRAEMAKMISVAVNGGEDVGAYYANSCTFADSVNHWAAGYIAYCANEGIIDGRDANTFDPDANVTGTEAAKMMLVALGYDSKIEKLTGDLWAANVLKLAKANGLFDGCDDFNAGVALDRDNAAQIIFNGLQAEMVEYLFDAEISTGDTTVTVNTKVNPTGDALYEVAFDGDLAPGTASDDDFGRPAHSWDYDKEEIGVYTDTPDYTFVATVDDTIEDAIEAYDADLYEKFDDGDYALEDFVINGAGGYSYASKGAVVELFDVDDEATDEVEYLAVEADYYLYQITEVDTIVSDADAEDGISAYVTFENADFAESYTFDDVDIVGFDADTYVEDAVIAVAFDYDAAGDVVIDTFIPEKVTGEVTKFSSSSSAYTLFVDGDELEVGDYMFSNIDDEALAVENTYDFYLVNGYVYGSVLVEEESDVLYGVFLDAGYEQDAYGNETDYAKIFTAEGEEAEYVVDDEYAAYAAPADNTLVAYTLNEDGELDSIAAATEAVTAVEEKSVSANGIFDGKLVDENVVVFNDDNNDLTDPAWTVYGYDEFAAAEDGIACTYIVNDDGDIIAVYTTDETLVSKTTTVIGFYLGEDYDVITEDADGEYYTMKYMVAGAEKTYTTINESDVDYDGPFTWDAGELQVLTLNADGEITAIAAANLNTGLPTDDFGAYDGIYNEKADIVAVKGNNINVGTEAAPDLQYVGSAVVYTINADGEFVKSSLSKIKAGYDVYFFQLDEASEAWDAIVWAE